RRSSRTPRGAGLPSGHPRTDGPRTRPAARAPRPRTSPAQPQRARLRARAARTARSAGRARTARPRSRDTPRTRRAPLAQPVLEQHAHRRHDQRPLVTVVRDALLAALELAALELRDALLVQLLERDRRHLDRREVAARRGRDTRQALGFHAAHDLLRI